MKKLLIIFLIFLAHFSKGQECPIIPRPAAAQLGQGSFKLGGSTVIVAQKDEEQFAAFYLQNQLLKYCGITPSIQSKDVNKSIVFLLTDKVNGNSNEAYQLNIKSSEIIISSSTKRGLFYGAVSLLQLFRLGEVSGKSIIINCWQIKDEPRYSWRGLLLDESRHFWGTETVKELLEWMSYYKLNKFHWHLTDEPGWRIQINAYPLLALNGGVGVFGNKTTPAQYYTQAQIADIIAFAAARNIEVIPEIDMPGHAAAANRAYPKFSGGGSEKYPDFTFNPGFDTTYKYLSTILHEVDALFPSQLIHIGGDEVSFGNQQWKADSSIMRLMKRENLRNMDEVSAYFTRRMADTINKMNNRVLLWDEAADNNLSTKGTLIFWWRHDKPEQLKKALDKKFEVVLCPRLPFYLDFMQDSTQKLGRKWHGDLVTTDKLYNFDPGKLGITVDSQKQILGVQGALWTEYITSVNKLQYMLFPRITALAETGWTAADQKNIGDFHKRLAMQFPLYHKAGIYYYDLLNTTLTPEPLSAGEIETTVNKN